MSLKGRSCWVVNIRMVRAEELSLEAIGRFVTGSEDIRFEAEDRQQLYGWVEKVLVGRQYAQQGKAARGLLRRYVEKMTGLSRAQITRLIARYAASGRVQVTVYRRRRFAELYTRADIELLAAVDEAHEMLSGPATRRILEREFEVYKRPEYARLATISVAHLYNLRHHQRYRERLLNYTRTRPTAVSIGERRKPQPQGQPGFLRLDTVHQGDQPNGGEKGVYHINAVDCVTQYEGVATCERISENYLIPVLEELLCSFPFVLRGFHTDNGSEYINRRVAKLLNSLLIEEQTKSRSRHSNDNAQAESKNGSIVRKHFGYSHIPQRHASVVNTFCREHLNPYINFHRPCLYPQTHTDEKGRQRKRYPYSLMMTPYEKLKSLADAPQHLKPGLTFEHLDALAYAISDNEAARRMTAARVKLFRSISDRSASAA